MILQQLIKILSHDLIFKGTLAKIFVKKILHLKVEERL